jgi:hypothetical protein
MTFGVPDGGEAHAHVGATYHDVPDAPNESTVDVDLELHEADRRRALIEATEAKSGDKGKLWRRFGFLAGDEFYYRSPSVLSKGSPMFSFAIVDGAYTQALFGNLSFLLPIIGFIAGIAASVEVAGNALPPTLPLFSVLLVLGILNAFAGLAGYLAFLAGAIITGHFLNEHEIITLFVLGCNWFAGPQIGQRLRPLKAHHDHTGFERLWHQWADIGFIIVISTFILGKFCLIYPLVTGYEVKIAENEQQVWLIVIATYLVRLGLQTIAREWFPRRMAQVEAKPLATRNRWINLFFIAGVQMAIVILALHIAVGSCWQLWVISVLYTFMLVVERTKAQFPFVTWLHRIIPVGVARIVIVVVLGQLSASYFLKHGYTTAKSLTAMIFLVVAGVLFVFATLGKFRGKPWPDHHIWKFFGALIMLTLMAFGAGVITLV